MAGRSVWVFYYGSFIDLEVLAGSNVNPTAVEVGWVSGFDIAIGPLATMVPAEGSVVYGILARTTHEELTRLYSQDWVAEYAPEAVIVTKIDRQLVPALCYIAAPARTGPAKKEYIDKIAGAGRKWGFPAWYVERIESFRE